MHSIVFSLFAGKSYAIFALLFGLTFYIQQSNQRKRGKDFGYRFLWRLLLLVVFSFINSMVYPGGDVLMLFAFMALLLFITRNWSTKWVFALAILFLLHPYEWIQQLLGNSLHPQLNVALYGEVALAATEGSHLDFILSNLWTGQKASLMWAFENGRLFQTGGLFLLGMLAGRISIFEETDKNRRIWRNLLMISAVLFAPFFTLSQMYAGSYAGVALDMWQKLLFTAILLSTFIQLYWSVDGFKRLCSPLLCYGRMSLTNYISQTYIGAFIFMPIGLHLAPHVGATLSLAIGLVILFLQIWFSNYWMKNHKQGPLEWLWHKWTWIGVRE